MRKIDEPSDLPMSPAMREDLVGFRCYEINGQPVVPGGIMDHQFDALRYCLNAGHLVYHEPPPDPRSPIRKFIDEWKRRLTNAWYALKGGECD